MTDRELRKLNRTELLELLVAQGRELTAVQRQLDEAREQLKTREIVLEKAGSIAEASIQLNNVINAAQRAADQYTYNMERFCAEHMAQCEAEEAERREASMQALDDARGEAESLVAEGQQHANELIDDARRQAKQLMDEAHEKARRLQEEAMDEAKAECRRLTEGAKLQAEAIVTEAKRKAGYPLEQPQQRKRHFWQRGVRE